MDLFEPGRIYNKKAIVEDICTEDSDLYQKLYITKNTAEILVFSPAMSHHPIDKAARQKGVDRWEEDIIFIVFIEKYTQDYEIYQTIKLEKKIFNLFQKLSETVYKYKYMGEFEFIGMNETNTDYLSLRLRSLSHQRRSQHQPAFNEQEIVVVEEDLHLKRQKLGNGDNEADFSADIISEKLLKCATSTIRKPKTLSGMPVPQFNQPQAQPAAQPQFQPVAQPQFQQQQPQQVQAQFQQPQPQFQQSQQQLQQQQLQAQLQQLNQLQQQVFQQSQQSHFQQAQQQHFQNFSGEGGNSFDENIGLDDEEEEDDDRIAFTFNKNRIPLSLAKPNFGTNSSSGSGYGDKVVESSLSSDSSERPEPRTPVNLGIDESWIKYVTTNYEPRKKLI